MSQAELEKKVADYLLKSQALEDYWERPITAEQLQAELGRMTKNTRQPEVLRELFIALGNDPFLIAECLARPALAERSLTDWYGYDERVHGELKQRARAELQAHPTIEQVKQTNGTYTEIELLKGENGQGGVDSGVSHSAKLASGEWDEAVQKLAGTFSQRNDADALAFGVRRHVVPFEPPARHESIPPVNSAISAHSKEAAAEMYETIPVGKLSSLQEDEEHYYASAVIEKTAGHLKLATVAWLKEPLESWLSRAENQVPAGTTVPNASYTLPEISEVGCTVNTWAAPTSMNAPRGRFNPTAVWTGSELIVWGGYDFVSDLLFNTGGRYNPSTDTWIAVTTNNAPEPRTHHTAVWTGTEMIVWGGNVEDHSLNTGGRYDPTTNHWVRTSMTNAPPYRAHHTAVWTGRQMIIWGGTDSYTVFNTGSRYNPSTNTWVSTSTTNAPAARYLHTAVWTGSEMIAWGGNGGDMYTNTLNSGGRYNPTTNTWTPTSTVNAPQSRWFHTAVWTGSLMIVWGGDHGDFVQQLNTGGKYNPSTNTWSSTSTINGPAHRDSHSAVWTGSEMIVWGGFAGSADTRTGGRYHPDTNSWTATTTSNAPSARETHKAIWTGTEMIIWGGGNADDSWGLSTGGRYNPTNNTWLSTNGNAATARSAHTAVWTGTEMIVWGGEEQNVVYFGAETNTGGRFSPSTDTWVATRNNSAPSKRSNHTAVWTGTRMIVWGGYFYDVHGGHFLSTGGKYDPNTNSWTAISTANAPASRENHTAVWTGSEMIVWGGLSDFYLNTGGRYNPDTNNWAGMSLTNAPSGRYHHTAVWSGSEMVVWGGADHISYFNTGGRYNPISDIWTGTSLSNAPSGREAHTAVWAGSEMIVWGGDSPGVLGTGSRYNPGTNSWAATSIANAPSPRVSHAAVWTGSNMIVWGGDDGNDLNTGGRYNPITDSWAPTSTINAPIGRRVPTAVWTGSEMIVWGGLNAAIGTETGGRYCAH
jgi:N-acetylneuraminic acid mutarotase